MNAKVIAALVVIVLPATATIAQAHIIPWRPGESRQIGFGHCAKGACMKRTSFAESKPHLHVNGKVVFPKIAPGYPASRGWW